VTVGPTSAIPNGGGDDISIDDLQTYNIVKPNPENNEQEQILNDVEERLDAIAEGWEDSGGPGGFQVDVSREVLLRAAALAGDLQGAVRQWSRSPDRSRAQIQMIGALIKALTERDRLLLELRERLNASPY
jgi:hypothetical protein